MLNLPNRQPKPRKEGITAVTDIRLSTRALEGILEDYHEFIDVAKLGVGVAYIMPNLKEKIALYKKYGVEVYFGGTLFEKFYSQNKVDEYLNFVKDNGVDWIEVSCGTVDISIEERCKIVEETKNDFTVLSEVGSKDAEKIMPPSLWLKEIFALLEAGAEYVITEGRDSATAGIYRPSGELRTGLLSDIISNVPNERLIFEAPSPKLQMHFINLVGANVNLGNINPNDLLLLETQRRGLRNETFDLK